MEVLDDNKDFKPILRTLRIKTLESFLFIANLIGIYLFFPYFGGVFVGCILVLLYIWVWRRASIAYDTNTSLNDYVNWYFFIFVVFLLSLYWILWFPISLFGITKSNYFYNNIDSRIKMIYCLVGIVQFSYLYLTAREISKF